MLFSQGSACEIIYSTSITIGKLMSISVHGCLRKHTQIMGTITLSIIKICTFSEKSRNKLGQLSEWIGKAQVSTKEGVTE